MPENTEYSDTKDMLRDARNAVLGYEHAVKLGLVRVEFKARIDAWNEWHEAVKLWNEARRKWKLP